MESQRAKLKQLILDVETLMQTARAEAHQIVTNAEAKARDLVAAAEQLHATAEAESARLRTTADEARRRAEREARRLSDAAHAHYETAIEEARTVTETPPLRLSRDLRAGVGSAATPTSNQFVAEASRRADQMLRVARAEAKSRADETIEQARRRAAQIDDDARRREQVAAKQFREMQRRMRDEQLEIKSRIAELRYELRSLEAASREVGSPVDPADGEWESAETSVESEEALTLPNEVRLDHAERASSDHEPPSETDTAHRTEEHREPDRDTASGDEYKRAVKRFRRRA